MHMEVVPTLGKPFLCSVIYAATDKFKRSLLFNTLATLETSINGPWIVIGDFNCMANLSERIGHYVWLSKVRSLRDCMEKCNLHDMRSNGRFFTWNNKQEGKKRVFSNIDRTLCNSLWEDCYPTVEVSFLPEGEFDHSPMLLQFFSNPTSKKPFKFCNFWANNSKFTNIVSKVCLLYPGCKSFQIQEKLKLLKPIMKKELQHTPIEVSLLQAERDLTTAQDQLHQNPLNV